MLRLLPGYKAILISTIVDTERADEIKSGYKAILISTIVDYRTKLNLLLWL